MQRSLQESDTTLGPLLPLLTIPAVAKMLNVSRPTVYTLISREGLPIIKFGRAIRISPTSLQKWLIEREQ
jgi:excisionase family DNA binding protein